MRQVGKRAIPRRPSWDVFSSQKLPLCSIRVGYGRPQRRSSVKRLLAIAVTLLALANPAFAVMPTSEPSLPKDLGTWQRDLTMCTKHAGKTFVSTEYVQMAADWIRIIMTITLNSEKVVQGEVTQGANQKFVIYVRNSPGENWLEYTRKEQADAFKRFLDEIGLTEEQFNKACGE